MGPGAGAGRHRALDQLLLAETLFLTPFLIGFLQTLERTLSAPGPWRPLGSSSAWCSFGEVCHFILTLSEDYDEQPLGTTMGADVQPHVFSWLMINPEQRGIKEKLINREMS